LGWALAIFYLFETGPIDRYLLLAGFPFLSGRQYCLTRAPRKYQLLIRSTIVFFSSFHFYFLPIVNRQMLLLLV
jgi:hypothetical protein